MISKIRISKIEIQNYRSCLKTILEPNTNLSTLIGINASGKSNVLSAIMLLKKLNSSGRFSEYERITTNVSKLKTWFVIGKKTLKHQAIIRYSTDEHNRDEIYSSQEKWNFKEFTGKNRWIEIPLSFVGYTPNYYLKSGAKILYRYKREKIYPFPLKNEYILEKKYPILNLISELTSSITYYSASQFTDPSKCPASLEIDEEGALRQSFFRHNEHARFIYALYQQYKKSSKVYDQFLSIIGKTGVKLVDSIKFNEVKVPSRAVEVKTGGKVIKKAKQTLVVIPSFIIGKTKLSPNQLSEGTFKTLAIVFYLITDKSKILLLEEPEVCVHHGLLATVMELIKTFSSKKQIIITTHSDFVLDMLEPENVFIVQYLKDQGTVVKHIPKSFSKTNYKALKEYLNTSGNLGEYWRHGGFDK